MAQEAALKGIATGRLRKFLAYDKSFACANVNIVDTALLYKAQNKKGAPRWRGLASILHIDEAGVAVEFQSRTFKVARFCVRGKVEDAQVGGDEVDPLKERLRAGGLDLGSRQEPADEDDMWVRMRRSSGRGVGLEQEAIPAADSPSLSVQVPFSKGSVDHPPDPGSSFDKVREPPQAPKVNLT